MVVKMIKWRPWPPLLSKKFRVKIAMHGLKSHPQGEDRSPIQGEAVPSKVWAEVRWKGRPRAHPLSPMRRSVRSNCTRELRLGEDWNEDFFAVCDLLSHKDDAFHPWEVVVTVFNEQNDGQRSKSSILGRATMNLAEFANATEERGTDVLIPLSAAGIPNEVPLALHVTISLEEQITTNEFPETIQRPVISPPSSLITREAHSVEKDEFSAFKASLRKVKVLKEIVSPRKPRKPSQEDEGSDDRSSRTEDAENLSPFSMGYVDGLNEGELEFEEMEGNIRKSFSYDSLASANYLGRSLHFGTQINGEREDWIYYSHRRSDVGCSKTEEAPDISSSLTIKRSILPWKKRKISFKSPKSKGETLLKDYGEAGGDDIDFDRRQMTSTNGSLGVGGDENSMNASISEFGDDNFEVGRWQNKEFISRDGHMKLSAQVFFASIDQRSERAAGESACTALVVVIADWLHAYHNTMPIKSEFDRLIREGSLEWRNLCNNEAYQSRFPDKHFDLETILQAEVRSLLVVPEKSFIGFFHPEDIDGDSPHFGFLQGAMSFDKIWDEINCIGMESSSEGNTRVYIVSWNDHFFILEVDPEAYYIIDTLGERLYEGCEQAYVLKFDKETVIEKVHGETKEAGGEAVRSGNSKRGEKGLQVIKAIVDDNEGDDHVCQGKESCKEYIKSFLAALPIRELLVNIKKGSMPSKPLHQLLQIEFHYTEISKRCVTRYLHQVPKKPAAPVMESLQLAVLNEAST